VSSPTSRAGDVRKGKETQSKAPHIIMGDKEFPSAAAQDHVTCARANFGDLSFAVIQKGKAYDGRCRCAIPLPMAAYWPWTVRRRKSAASAASSSACCSPACSSSA